MSQPLCSLPVLQNWDCQACGNCCREYEVAVTEEERQRILGQGWEREPDFAGVPLFVRKGRWGARQYTLNQRSNGACVFLNEQGRCRIHERFGSEGKPFACRLYPFILVPAGRQWRVGMRYACPAAAASVGRPISAFRGDLDEYVAAMAKQTGLESPAVPAPSLQYGTRLDWPELVAFTDALMAILRQKTHPLEQRLRQWLALARICGHATFDQIRGGKLGQLLELLSAGAAAETPADAAQVPRPSLPGRLLFRQFLALYIRRDHGPSRRVAVHSRLDLLRAAWRFARGSGRVPRLHREFPDTTFEQLEVPSGPLAPAAEEVLERYYAVKVSSMQFCGTSNFGMSFWEGVHAMALTLPVLLWLSRAYSSLGQPEAITKAVTVVDNNFGYNRLLTTVRQRAALGILARRGELERLIAWYSR
jgi:lysine-N-methylase